MAARIGLSFSTLRMMDTSACENDARLVWKDGDGLNVGVIRPGVSGAAGFVQGLHMSSARELRLLAKQMMRHADDLERLDDECEVVLP